MSKKMSPAQTAAFWAAQAAIRLARKEGANVETQVTTLLLEALVATKANASTTKQALAALIKELKKVA